MILLRDVGDADCLMLYRWQHEASTRKYFQNTRRLDWQEHVDWFCDKRSGEPGDAFWCIAEFYRENARETDSWNGIVMEHTVGTVSAYADADGRHWLTVVVAPEQRGKGYGTQVIAAASIRAYEKNHWPLCALVHRENLPSFKAFRRAGYIVEKTDGTWLTLRAGGPVPAGAPTSTPAK